MAEVTGLTAEAMQAIADASIVSGSVDGTGHLILRTSGGTNVDAGAVVGPAGAAGADGSSGSSPTGSMIMFGAATPPDGWLICDGSNVSRFTYSALFSVIGTTYGAGDGTTSFGLPNLQQRFPRQDTGALGASGGSATAAHSHSIANHIHSLSSAGWSQITMLANLIYQRKISSVTGWTPNTSADLSSASTGGSLNSGSGLDGNTDAGGTANTGSSTVATVPPYQNVNFIIKT